MEKVHAHSSFQKALSNSYPSPRALGACEASNLTPSPREGKGWVLHTTLHSEACCYRGKYRRERLQNKFPRFVLHNH